MPTLVLIAAIAALILILSVKIFVRACALRQHQPGEVVKSSRVPKSWILHELEKRMGEFSPHRGKEIICYCRSGNRSSRAAAKLVRQGFSAANLKGGIMEWKYQHQRTTGP